MLYRFFQLVAHPGKTSLWGSLAHVVTLSPSSFWTSGVPALLGKMPYKMFRYTTARCVVVKRLGVRVIFQRAGSPEDIKRVVPYDCCWGNGNTRRQTGITPIRLPCKHRNASSTVVLLAVKGLPFIGCIEFSVLTASGSETWL